MCLHEQYGYTKYHVYIFSFLIFIRENNNSEHLHNIYPVPGAVLSALSVLIYLIFIITLWGKY